MIGITDTQSDSGNIRKYREVNRFALVRLYRIDI